MLYSFIYTQIDCLSNFTIINWNFATRMLRYLSTQLIKILKKEQQQQNRSVEFAQPRSFITFTDKW